MNIKEWTDILIDPTDPEEALLEIIKFPEPCKISPFGGKPWGLLLSRKNNTLYPYCGPLVMFEETKETVEIFSHFRAKIEKDPSLSKLGKLVASGRDTYGDGDAKDGLYAEEQIPRYLVFYVIPFWKALEEMALSLWEKLWPKPSGAVMLDLGCGPGRILWHLAKRKYRVVGLDLSYSMLRSIVERDDGTLGNYLLILSSANRIPLKSSSINSITSFGVIHHVPYPRKTFSEINRTLKLGGSFQALENNATPFRFIFDFFFRHFPLWEENAGEHPLMTPKIIRGWAKGLPFRFTFKRSIYFIPNMVSFIKNVKTVKQVIRFTDLLDRIPGISRWGGLLWICGVKEDSPGK